YDIRCVDRRHALEIEPNLAQPPDVAIHVAEEGVVEPLNASLALLAAARSLGAEINGHTHVKRLTSTAGAVTGLQTEAGPIEADHVVLAAGAGVPPLAASAGLKVPLTTPAGLLVHSKPIAPILNGLVMAPELHLRQTPEGRLIAGSDFGGAEPGADPGETARALFAKVKAFVRGGDR